MWSVGCAYEIVMVRPARQSLLRLASTTVGVRLHRFVPLYSGFRIHAGFGTEIP